MSSSICHTLYTCVVLHLIVYIHVLCSISHLLYKYVGCRGMEEVGGSYDSDDDADFTKMDMVGPLL